MRVTTFPAKGFNCLPVELHQQILRFMDPEDLLALRKTSKYFLAFTRDPSVWTAIYHRMQQSHLLNCSESEFAALTLPQSERLLVRASKTEQLFQTFREHAHHSIVPSGQKGNIGPLRALSFLSERFLLSVDGTTVVYVWDTSKLASSAEGPTFPCARLALAGWHFSTYGMTCDYSTLYVVLSKGRRAHVFSLSLPVTTSDMDEPKLTFRDVAYFDTHFYHIHSIDADSRLVFFQVSDTIIQVVDWRTGNRGDIPLPQEPNGAHWNLVAICVCGPYILCVRRQSVDAYPVPLSFLSPAPATDQMLPVLQHTMSNVDFFANVSLSRVRCSRSPSGDVYSLWVLSRDTHYRAYHQQIDVRTTPVPALSVKLSAFDGTHTERRITALDLGSTGLRGVWVHAPNSSGERHVVAFSAFPSRFRFPSESCVAASTPGLSGDAETRDMPPRFEERIVSIVSSRYSDDDVTICAVSEFTGRIALGSRTGTITVL